MPAATLTGSTTLRSLSATLTNRTRWAFDSTRTLGTSGTIFAINSIKTWCSTRARRALELSIFDSADKIRVGTDSLLYVQNVTLKEID
jgi:hypothetical protein